MKLLEPGYIGKLEIRNKIIMLPVGTRLADEKGFVTDRLINFYEERAKGGAGMIIVEVSSVDYPRGSPIKNSIAIDNDEAIPGLKKLSDRIKKHGARAAIQIGHAGNAAFFKITGETPVAPSAVKRGRPYQMPKELNIQEIKQHIRYFAEAVQRARTAGFEGVEIHGAHFYLISQFLSSAWNKRQDSYGGDLVNRARFLMEIISASRDLVGTEYPLWCRINGTEGRLEGGTVLSEAKQTAKMIENKTDAISVSAADTGVNFFTGTCPDVPGALLPLAKAVKDVVNIPVIGAGRITPELAETALAEEMVDLIGLARSLLADPYLPKKLAEGNKDAIKPCIICLNCTNEAEPISCSVNACLGNEAELRIQPTQNAKKCFIAGGGPAGMTAAITAVEMGHHVTLFEKDKQLGGQLLPASLPPCKSEMIEPLTFYMKRKVETLNLDIKLGTELTTQILDKEKPDILINATGVKQFIPDIPGINGQNVVTALEVLEGKEVGENIAIIGAELVGCETADYLAERGKQVVIMRRGSKMAVKIAMGRRLHLLDRLSKLGVTALVDITYEEIVENGIIIKDREGKSRLIEADNIIVAAGYLPNTDLLEVVSKNYPDIQVINIGDSLDPRGIQEAIYEGHQIFRSIK
jgi:2,4-dienoyl-CoA reductase-like NADH-dependent reductase (Old Yellow Enzyme family)/thioredoxin reductase